MKDPTKPLPESNLFLHCQICGNEVGSTYTPVPMTEDEYRTRGGIVDQRCDQCEAAHGTYASLVEAYEKEVEADPAKAEVFVKRNRKRADFEAALSTEKEKRLRDKNIIE